MCRRFEFKIRSAFISLDFDCFLFGTAINKHLLLFPGFAFANLSMLQTEITVLFGHAIAV
jgi:hypothetical protein